MRAWLGCQSGLSCANCIYKLTSDFVTQFDYFQEKVHEYSRMIHTLLHTKGENPPPLP